MFAIFLILFFRKTGKLREIIDFGVEKKLLGKLSSRHQCSTETTLHLYSKLEKAYSSIEDLLNLLSSISELAKEFPLRSNEIDLLEKRRTRACFETKKVETTLDKLRILIQDSLLVDYDEDDEHQSLCGNSESQLRHEAREIARMMRFQYLNLLVDLAIERQLGDVLKFSLILRRSYSVKKPPNDSAGILESIPGLRPKLAKKLRHEFFEEDDRDFESWDDLKSRFSSSYSSVSKINSACGRNYDFGNSILNFVKQVKILQMTGSLRENELRVEIETKPEVLEKNLTVPKEKLRQRFHLLCVSEADGKKIRLHRIVKPTENYREVVYCNSDNCVIYLISDDLPFLDVTLKLKLGDLRSTREVPAQDENSEVVSSQN